MNSFGQRLMERAQVRREKLNTYLSNIGNEAPEPRTPLQEQNVHQLLKIKTEVEVSLHKARTNSEKENDPGNGDSYKCSTTYTLSRERPSEAVKSSSEIPAQEECHESDNVDDSESDDNDSASGDNDSVSGDNGEDISSENDAGKIEDINYNERNTKNTMRENTRSFLKRLGALYSDETLSSPIHRTEETFLVTNEEEEPTCENNSKPARLPRLAALASKVNSWEDEIEQKMEQKKDLQNHGVNKGSSISQGTPSMPSTPSSAKSENKKLVNSTPLAKTGPSTSVPHRNIDSKDNKKINKPSPGKLALNKDLKNKLESQGFYRAKSESPSKATDTSPSTKSPRMGISNLKSPSHSPQVGEISTVRNSPRMGISNFKSPSKPPASPVKTVNGPPSFPVMGVRASPRKQAETLKNGSVLHKTTIFESPTKKVPEKDPTELSIAERKALFEQKKGTALIPKAPFGMAVPTPQPKKKDNTAVGVRSIYSKSVAVEDSVSAKSIDREAKGNDGSSDKCGSVKKLLPQFQMFEKMGNSQLSENVSTSQKERQKELEMLNNRWNSNKSLSSAEGENINKKSVTAKAVVDHFTNKGAAKSPNLQKKEVTFNRDVVAIVPMDESQGSIDTSWNCSPPPPPPPPLPPSPSCSSMSPRNMDGISPKRYGSSMSPRNKMVSDREDFKYPGVTGTRRIKISPTKPGNLYPSLSDIEATTETESDMPDVSSCSASSEEFNSSGDCNSSFGKEILRAAGLNKSLCNNQIGNPRDSDTSDESDVMDDMDGFLNEALADDSDSDNNPTPPKKKCDGFGSASDYSPTTSQSHSFKYTRGSPSPMSTSEGDSSKHIPLMHTISFYRRQQNMSAANTPVKKIVRKAEVGPPVSEMSSGPNADEAITEKTQQLLDEVTKQQTVISQASQALNLCCATVEFSGSSEQVEGERLLLLATHRRQAALNEIQRLRVENSLKPITGSANSTHLLDKGALIVWSITLPLKREYIRYMASENMCRHFVCLLRSQDQVFATQVVDATPQNIQKNSNSITFPGSLRLEGLYSDFKAMFEIYSMETPKEILPHDIKYHINKKDGNKSRLTPKKILNKESQLVMPLVQSPAGPSAVRSPNFTLEGYVVFSLREVGRTSFTLNKVQYTSPLEGSVQLKLNSELTLDVTQRGFLTMFEDVSGFGAWHRRWCLLKGASLSYWKYPADEEGGKEPIGQIDLNKCVTQTIGLVSRDICARPHTFLLETTRIGKPEDRDSLVMIRGITHTTLRHLMSADTKEERLQWCAMLNKSLTMLRAWNSTDALKH